MSEKSLDRITFVVISNPFKIKAVEYIFASTFHSLTGKVSSYYEYKKH